MSYISTILAESGLVLYHQLADTTGTVSTDSSSGANPGTYTGGFTLNQSTSYPLTPAVTFNGSTGYVDVADATNLHLTDVTMEAWIKTSSSSSQTILGKYPTSPFHGWALGVGVITAGKVSLWSGSGSWVTGNISVNDNVWHHIVGTISSAGIVKTYIDSILDLSLSVLQSLSNTQNLKIGRDPQVSSAFFNGSIMHCAVYNTVLSVSSISNHFAQVGDTGAIRITQAPIRVFVNPTDQAIRLTQAPMRVFVNPTDQKLRITQESVRTLIRPPDNIIRVTQMPIRVLRINTPDPPFPAALLPAG